MVSPVFKNLSWVRALLGSTENQASKTSATAGLEAMRSAALPDSGSLGGLPPNFASTDVGPRASDLATGRPTGYERFFQKAGEPDPLAPRTSAIPGSSSEASSGNAIRDFEHLFEQPRAAKVRLPIISLARVDDVKLERDFRKLEQLVEGLSQQVQAGHVDEAAKAQINGVVAALRQRVASVENLGIRGKLEAYLTAASNEASVSVPPMPVNAPETHP